MASLSSQEKGGRGGKFSREILQRPTTSYPLDAWLWPRRVKRKKKEAAFWGREVTRAEEERWGGGRKDRELSPTMRSLPTWWIEVSFENVCAHGQIHKEGCKPRLRPSSGGSLISRTKFHPIPPADDAIPLAPPRPGPVPRSLRFFPHRHRPCVYEFRAKAVTHEPTYWRCLKNENCSTLGWGSARQELNDRSGSRAIRAPARL